ncbi:hypothetical protein QWZ13_16470 [Reinekea marina]|uniref:hypothetical protein n=1 Tax=Reinekea marina TaxID=1310421 RepID=UPI0025B52FDB|nr:hypothetical protein [Reinekea marina]MDN3650503.1 hypothetical protein [Reinekea marina]
MISIKIGKLRFSIIKSLSPVWITPMIPVYRGCELPRASLPFSIVVLQSLCWQSNPEIFLQDFDRENLSTIKFGVQFKSHTLCSWFLFSK